jgi:hypothetical protein
VLNNEDSTNLNSNLQQQQPGGNQQTPGQMGGGSGMQIKTEDMVNDPLGTTDFLNNIQQSQLAMPGGGSGGGGGGRMGGMQPQTSIDGTNVQPLPSNVMNKQSNSMEVSASLPNILD